MIRIISCCQVKNKCTINGHNIGENVVSFKTTILKWSSFGSALNCPLHPRNKLSSNTQLCSRFNSTISWHHPRGFWYHFYNRLFKSTVSPPNEKASVIVSFTHYIMMCYLNWQWQYHFHIDEWWGPFCTNTMYVCRVRLFMFLL